MKNLHFPGRFCFQCNRVGYKIDEEEEHQGGTLNSSFGSKKASWGWPGSWKTRRIKSVKKDERQDGKWEAMYIVECHQSRKYKTGWRAL